MKKLMFILLLLMVWAPDVRAEEDADEEVYRPDSAEAPREADSSEPVDDYDTGSAPRSNSTIDASEVMPNPSQSSDEDF